MAEPALPQKLETTPVIRPLRSPPASSLLQPLPTLAGILPSHPGPRNETARIAILPGRSVAAVATQTGPAIVPTSTTSNAFDSTPRWFCWGLLGVSALIFLIQIWNYALS